MKNDLILSENKLQLSEDLIKLLNAKTGDKIAIGYTSVNGNLKPVISIDESGNKLSSKGTVIFKGKQRDMLAQYGTEFTVIFGVPLVLEGNNPEFKVFTSVEKAIEWTIDKDTVLNKNFNILNYSNYEF